MVLVFVAVLFFSEVENEHHAQTWKAKARRPPGKSWGRGMGELEGESADSPGDRGCGNSG